MFLFPDLYGKNGGSVGLLLSNTVDGEVQSQLVRILDELTASKSEDLSGSNQSLDADLSDKSDSSPKTNKKRLAKRRKKKSFVR